MKNPSYAREIALKYVNWENRTVHKIIEAKKINAVWEPFKEENKQIVQNVTNLYWIENGIDNNIIFKDEYTYDLFLIDFYKFNLSVTHYRDLPTMADKWNEFVNSDLIKKFCLRCYPEIDSSLGRIKNNIEKNESYILTNLNEDLSGLNNSIQDESYTYKIEKTWKKFKEFVGVIFGDIRAAIVSLIVVAIIGYLQRRNLYKYIKKLLKK